MPTLSPQGTNKEDYMKEEVKKILEASRTGVKVTSNGIVNFIEYPISVDELATQLCQLLKIKYPENPYAILFSGNNNVEALINNAKHDAWNEAIQKVKELNEELR